ncbi:MAG: hypothetical protein ACI8RZ_000422 [Myxococcota bacterium]|jgi:hypothetical protein
MRAPYLLALCSVLSLYGCSDKGDDTGDGVDCDPITFYADGDSDGYGDAADTIDACEAPSGYIEDATDCDDSDAGVSPASAEACDGVDNNCDGIADEGVTTALFADVDGDGYGDPDSAAEVCSDASGYTDDSTDCDDTAADAFPGGVEVCDGLDNDCDGTADNEPTDGTVYYADSDGDGLGDPDFTAVLCDAVSGYVENFDDCDDTYDAISACCSTGTDGSWEAIKDTDLESGTYWLERFYVAKGVEVRVDGEEPLVIYANEIVIDGVLDLTGRDGALSSSTSVPNGGPAGPGGGGGGGGSDCGNGGGTGGTPNGGTPSGYVTGGSGGLAWGLSDKKVAASVGGGWGPGSGGGGGASALDGLDGSGGSGKYSLGGDAYGEETLAIVFTGGSGGAGGGANGGGGGGGGGAVALFSNYISIDGIVDVSGGEGGGKTDGGCTSGGGGGGGGGAIWLSGDVVEVIGSLDAFGGAGALTDSAASLNQTGGDGSQGRVRINGTVTDVVGTVNADTDYRSTDPLTCTP